MKKITLYFPIYRSTADLFVNMLNQVEDGEDVEILMNTPGGSVFAGWSIIGPLAERKGKNIAKVYGDASSMGFFMLLFMDEVHAIDTANFMIHRADGYVESDEDKKWLAEINKNLRSKLEKKIDAKVFQDVTGKSFNEIFDPNQRINVFLTAKQAKAIGLVNKVIRLEPKQIQALNEKFVAFADFDELESRGSDDNSDDDTRGSVKSSIDIPRGSGEQKTENKVEPKKISQMTKEELKAQNPEVYNAILAEGKEQGIEAERDRVQAYMAFVDLDATAVSDGIKSGKPTSQTFFAEMSRKAMSPEKIKEAEAESAGPQDPKAEEPKVEPKKDPDVEAAEKVVNEALGLKEEEVK